MFLASEQDMLEMGRSLAARCKPGVIIYLQGPLGAGKTTLTRGLLQGLGYHGIVKSPTYTLVEPYDLAQGPFFHFDLYRLNDPNELADLGLDDYFTDDAIVIVEWPEKAGGLLPAAMLYCNIEIPASGEGRLLTLSEEPLHNEN